MLFCLSFLRLSFLRLYLFSFYFCLIRGNPNRFIFLCWRFLYFLCLWCSFLFISSLFCLSFSRSFFSLSFSGLTNFRRSTVKSLFNLLFCRSNLYSLWLRFCLCLRLFLFNSIRGILHTSNLLFFITEHAIHVLHICVALFFEEINNFLTLLIYFSSQLTYFHFRHFIAFPI